MGYKDFNDYELLYYVDLEDDDAKEILLVKYMPLIVKQAKLYIEYLKQREVHEVSLGDLIMIGQEALLETIRKYDERRNVLFYSYFLLCLTSKYRSYSRSFFTKNRMVSLSYDEFSYEVEDSASLIAPTDYHGFGFVELQQILKQEAAQFSTIERMVLKMKMAGYRHKEIAQLLALDLQKVNRMVYVTRHKLRKIMFGSGEI